MKKLNSKKIKQEIEVEIVPIIFEEVEQEVKSHSKLTEFKIEVDEMQSFVRKKGNQRWLWHGIDHYTGEVLAYVLGSRTDEMFLFPEKAPRTIWNYQVLY